jgi:hypothetical protein
VTDPTPIIRQVGASLYGERWQSPLAAALKVSERSVQRWASGSSPVPVGVLRDLLALVITRSAALADLVPILEQAIADSER